MNPSFTDATLPGAAPRSTTTATAAPDLLRNGALRSALDKVRGLTMVHETALADLAQQVDMVLADGVEGAFVECGVWCGGASFLMADLLRRAGVTDRKVWLFDSFEGMPAPQAIDGPAAMAWARARDKPWYGSTIPFSLEAVQRNAAALGVAHYTEFVKGWFDKTLPATRQRIGPIALLRIDCDWYASVKCCLDNLYDQVADGGFVVLDDYYTYDGCTLAVHEFLNHRGVAHRIESVSGDWQGCEVHYAASFRKGATNWKIRHRLLRLRQDVAAHVAPERRFIFIDEEQFRSELFPEGRAIPFLERDGHYNGRPADDESAIRELERLRHANNGDNGDNGAIALVIAWTSRWWLDSYPRFARYLRDTYRCPVENDRVTIFDLRRNDGDVT